MVSFRFVKGFKVGSYCVEVIITTVAFAGKTPPVGSSTSPHPVIVALISAVKEAVVPFWQKPKNGLLILGQSTSMSLTCKSFGPIRIWAISDKPSLPPQASANIDSTSKHEVVV